MAAIALMALAAPSLLADRRMAGVGGWGTAWRALVRIPLGTVVLEEVAFRAVLPALLSPVAAAALFGLWHVAPTATTLDINGVRRHRAVALAGAVAVTAAVGLGLWELRVVAGGVAAPALVHVAANSGATVAAYWVLRG
jgi:membrane protease YdiL (CAAX protease family)